MAATGSARTFFQSPASWLAPYLAVVAVVTTMVYQVSHPGWVLLREARGLMARDDFASAVRVLEKARSAGLPPGPWQEELAQALLREGRGGEVLAIFAGKETASLSRARLVAGAYEQTQQPARALEIFSRYLSAGGSLDGEALLQYAGVLRQAKRFAEAEEAYRDVLAREPGSIKARFEMAELQAWQGRFAEAVPVLKDLVSSHPRDRVMRLALARALTWSGDYAGAEQAYRQLLSSP